MTTGHIRASDTARRTLELYAAAHTLRTGERFRNMRAALDALLAECAPDLWRQAQQTLGNEPDSDE